MPEQRIITVTYNDSTDDASDLFQYTETTRTVKYGASLMGWSNSFDGGASFTWSGKVPPPAGMAILWGDPSIATYFENQNYVFIGNLAVSDDMVPPGGTMNGDAGSFIDAGCVGRSVNGGVTFSAWQCVTNEESHIYDGTAINVDSGGNVWFAMRDVTASQIDVWRATSVNGTLVQFANPFPGKSMLSHPRLQSYGSTVYLMAQETSGRLWITKRSGSGWTTAVLIPTQFGPSFPLTFDLPGGEKLRTAYQFAFDIGNTQVTSGVGNPCPCSSALLFCSSGTCAVRDNVRVIYAGVNSTGTDLYMSTCNLNLTSCGTIPAWSTHISQARAGHQFNPVIDAFPGFLSFPPSWRATWLSREHDPTGGTMQVREANVMVFGSAPAFAENPLIAAHDVCADDRGFWGDYNDVKFFEPPPIDDFLTVRTDSSIGCNYQWKYTAQHVHVESVIF